MFTSIAKTDLTELGKQQGDCKCLLNRQKGEPQNDE